MNTSIGNTPDLKAGKPAKDQPDTKSEEEFSEASQIDRSQVAGSPADKSERKSGATEASDGQNATPRLPHERDESSDSHDEEDGVRPVMKRAHDDVASGKVDTDRAKPMDDTYQRQKGG